jgi:hypothetical protein
MAYKGAQGYPYSSTIYLAGLLLPFVAGTLTLGYAGYEFIGMSSLRCSSLTKTIVFAAAFFAIGVMQLCTGFTHEWYLQSVLKAKQHEVWACNSHYYHQINNLKKAHKNKTTYDVIEFKE